MAFTERYVTSAAAGGGAGTQGDPWNLTEGFANAVASDRVNIQSDAAYSLGGTTLPSASNRNNIIWRGYNSTIGDLDEVGRDTPANGSDLLTANMPAITITGIWTMQVGNFFMNLNMFGSLTSWLIGGTVNDQWGMYQCKVENTNNGSGARCITSDNDLFLIMCDVELSGTNGQSTVDADVMPRILYCKSKVVNVGSDHFVHLSGGCFIGNLCINGDRAFAPLTYGSRPSIVVGNTVYNVQTFYAQPTGAGDATQLLVNNHATDSVNWITGPGSMIGPSPIELFNRTRDITNLRTNLGDGLIVGEILTDTGGPETDYTDFSADDFSLIGGAPGEDAGLKIG